MSGPICMVNNGTRTRGYKFLSLLRRTDRVHLSSELMPTVWSAYTVAISDHRAVAVQTGPPQGPEGGPRFRFPTDMLEDDVGGGNVGEGVDSSGAVASASSGVVGEVGDRDEEVGGLGRKSRPAQGCMQLDALVRESTRYRRATEGWEFLEDRGHHFSTDKQAYQQMLRLQAQAKEAEFKTGQESRLRRQLQTKAERVKK